MKVNEELKKIALETIKEMSDSQLINCCVKNKGKDINQAYIKNLYIEELEKRFM